MHTLRQFLMAAVCVVTLHAAHADEIEVTVNHDQIYLGESFIMSVTVHGTTSAEQPDISGLKGCTATLVGQAPRQSVTIINGSVNRIEEITFSYEIHPLASGTFSTGPIFVTHNGNKSQHAGPTVQVQGDDAQNDVLLFIEPSRTNVLVDESFQVTVRLCLKRLTAPNADADPLNPDDPPHVSVPFLDEHTLDGLIEPPVRDIVSKHHLSQQRAPGFSLNRYVIQMSPFDGMPNFPGFNLPDSSQPALFMFDRSEFTTSGIAYFQYALTLDYKATRLGDYMFGPADFKGTVVTGVDHDGHAITKSIYKVASNLTVRVVPPPTLDRPASYIGALVTGLTAIAKLDSHSCQIGDPIKLTLEIQGVPHPDQAYAPNLAAQSNLWQAFKFYPDTMASHMGDNSCTYTCTIRPTAPGTQEFPPIDVSFFDTSTRTYRTTQTPALPIQVIENPEVDVAAIMSSQRPAATATRTMEVSALTAPPLGTLESTIRENELPGPPAVLLLMATGPVVYVLVRLGRRMHASHRRRISHRKKNHALAHARSRLKTLSGEPATTQTAGQLCDVIREYLSDATGIHARGMTPADLVQALSTFAVPPQLAAEFTALYDALFAASYLNTPSTDAETHVAPEQLASMLLRLDPLLKQGARTP